MDNKELINDIFILKRCLYCGMRAYNIGPCKINYCFYYHLLKKILRKDYKEE
jgi:hypothetical protein